MTKASTKPVKLKDVKEAIARKKSEKKESSPPAPAPESQKPPSASPDAPQSAGQSDVREAIAAFHADVVLNAYLHRTDFPKCQRPTCVSMRLRLKQLADRAKKAATA